MHKYIKNKISQQKMAETKELDGSKNASQLLQKSLKLLGGPSDEHIMAGLVTLLRVKPGPDPAIVLQSLKRRGSQFIARMLSTGLKESSPNHAYVTLSLSILDFLLQESTSEAFLLNLASPADLIEPLQRSSSFSTLTTLLSTAPSMTVGHIAEPLPSYSPASEGFLHLYLKNCSAPPPSLLLDYLSNCRSLPSSLSLVSLPASFSSPSLASTSIKVLLAALQSEPHRAQALAVIANKSPLPHPDPKFIKTYLRLTCGEIRLCLGSLLDSQPASKNSAYVPVLVDIFLSSVESLLDEEGTPLPFECLLHMKSSLEDAVDSTTQYLSECQMDSPHISLLAKILGCWYSENDIEDSMYIRTTLSKALYNSLRLSDDPLSILPALSKVASQANDNPSAEFITQYLLNQPDFTSIVIKYLTASLNHTLWTTDLLSNLAPSLIGNDKSLSGISISIGKALPKPPLASLYLLSAFFNVAMHMSTVRLDDVVSGNILDASSTIFSTEVDLSEEHEQTLTDLCYTLANNNKARQVLEITCAQSRDFEDIAHFVMCRSME